MRRRDVFNTFPILLITADFLQSLWSHDYITCSVLTKSNPEHSSLLFSCVIFLQYTGTGSEMTGFCLIRVNEPQLPALSLHVQCCAEPALFPVAEGSGSPDPLRPRRHTVIALLKSTAPGAEFCRCSLFRLHIAMHFLNTERVSTRAPLITQCHQSKDLQSGTELNPHN